MDKRRLRETMGDAPMGDPRIPYDQTDPMVQGAPTPPPPDPAAALQGSAPAMSMPAASVPPGAPGGTDPGAPADPGMLAQLGGGMPGAPPAPPAQGDPSGAMSSDQMTGDQLAALSQPINDLQSPEEQQVAQMDQALNDPSTPPQVKQQLQQILDLAARRRMAGVGGPQA